MNIITFDTEEWYIEKALEGDRADRYPKFDYYLKEILDLLDETNTKGTFFCLGKLATMYPEVVKAIADKGHEIGCHSDIHTWLTEFDRKQLLEDTRTAISALEDLTGKKVLSYRAPAFSICPKNKWAFEVLAECGIERDASIYPSERDFGGFPDFPADKPCLVKVGDVTMKEFPICMTHILGKSMAYSGGGYFRLFPYWYVKREIDKSDYAITYFHIIDLMPHEGGMMSKEVFEEEYGIKATWPKRLSRHFKETVGTKTAFERMCRLVRECQFDNIEKVDRQIDWRYMKEIIL